MPLLFKIDKKLLFKLMFIGISFFFRPHVVLAEIKSPLERLKSFGGWAGYNTGHTNVEQTFTDLLGVIIGVFLSLLGIIFLVLIIYSGFTWMTAGGEEAKVTKAKDTLKRAIIGLIIVASSYIIWRMIVIPLL